MLDCTLGIFAEGLLKLVSIKKFVTVLRITPHELLKVNIILVQLRGCATGIVAYYLRYCFRVRYLDAFIVISFASPHRFPLYIKILNSFLSLFIATFTVKWRWPHIMY